MYIILMYPNRSEVVADVVGPFWSYDEALAFGKEHLPQDVWDGTFVIKEVKKPEDVA